MVLISAAISVVNCLQSALQLIPAHPTGFIILNNTIIFLDGKTVPCSRTAAFFLSLFKETCIIFIRFSVQHASHDHQNLCVKIKIV